MFLLLESISVPLLPRPSATENNLGTTTTTTTSSPSDTAIGIHLGTTIGIDLGTTYSCVGVWQHGRVEIITNDLGNRTTPSWVAFTQTHRLIGNAAQNQAPMNSANSIFDAKRLIGRKFSDETVQNDIKNWPFKVIANPKDTTGANNPVIVVTDKDEERQFSPEQISSMILEKNERDRGNIFG